MTVTRDGRRSPGEQTRDVLTVEQAAGYLQVHKATLYKYIREGTLPAVRLGKVYRLLRRDLDAFLAQHRTPMANGRA